MKYKLTLVILACMILIGGSIAETVYIDKTFDAFEKKVEPLLCQEEYSFEEVNELSKWWAKKSETLEIFISVLQLNAITVTLGELEGAVRKEDYDSASALVDRIYEYAVRIKDMYMVKFNNIL